MLLMLYCYRREVPKRAKFTLHWEASLDIIVGQKKLISKESAVVEEKWNCYRSGSLSRA